MNWIYGCVIVCAAIVGGSVGSASDATEVRKIGDAGVIWPYAGTKQFAEQVVFNPADSTLVAASARQEGTPLGANLVLINLATLGSEWAVTLGGGSGPLAFSHDGQLLLTHDGNKIVLLDAYTGAVRQAFAATIPGIPAGSTLPAGSPQIGRFSHDDSKLLLLFDQSFLYIDWATGQTVQDFSFTESGWDFKADIQLSPDERFALLLTKRALYVYNVATGDLVRKSEMPAALGDGDISKLENLRVTRDGAYSAFSSKLYVYIVDNPRRLLVRRQLAASDAISDINLTDDQCCFVTASVDGTSRVYDIATGNQITRLDDTRSDRDRVRLSAVASPKQHDVIVTADQSGAIRVWRP